MTRPKRASARDSTAVSGRGWSEIVRDLPGVFKANGALVDEIVNDALIVDFLDRKFESCGAEKKLQGIQGLVVWLDITASFSKKWRERSGRMKFDQFIELLRNPDANHRDRVRRLNKLAEEFPLGDARQIRALADRLVRKRGRSIKTAINHSLRAFWNPDDCKVHTPVLKPEAAWNGLVVRHIGRDVLAVSGIANPYATIARLAQLAGCPKVSRKYARAMLKR